MQRRQTLSGGSLRGDLSRIDYKIIILKCVLLPEGPLGLLDAPIRTMKSATLDLLPITPHSHLDRRKVLDIGLKSVGILAVRDAQIKNDVVPTFDQSPQATQRGGTDSPAIHSRPVVSRIASLKDAWRKGVDERVHGKAQPDHRKQ